jgi:uncharacterized membrane protein (UPF0127 family)
MSSFRRCTVLLLLAACLFASCAADPTVRIDGPDGAERAAVRVEVADTAPERETGLMYRSHLDEDAGMIFVFTAPSHQKFWMKNTEIPLDMIFADSAGRVIGIVHDARPYSESLDQVPGESQYVLEVNGGFAARHHVAAGDRFVFEHFTPQAKN